MIPHRYNETSSQPVNDLGGVPAVRDSFGKASARRGYVAAKLTAACNMPWLRKEPAGGRGKYGRTIMITSAGIRRIAVRLMLALYDSRSVYMKQNDFSQASETSLIDIRDIAVRNDLPREQRISEFIRQIKDPYHFKCGQFTVHVGFTPNGATLEECIAGIMR